MGTAGGWGEDGVGLGIRGERPWEKWEPKFWSGAV